MVCSLSRRLGLDVSVLRRFPVAEINLPPRGSCGMPDNFSSRGEFGDPLGGAINFNLGTSFGFSLPNTFSADPKDLANFR